MAPRICLRLHNFDTSIRKFWEESQTQKELYDVTLACEDKLIGAHKFILFCGSPVLRNILKENSNRNPVIYLRGVNYRDLCNILNFMYQGQVNIPEDEINSFLAVAEDLKIRGLSEEDKKLSEETEKVSFKQEKNESPKPKQNKVNDNFYNPSPKKKFLQLTNENQDFKHFETDHKDDSKGLNDIYKRNVGNSFYNPLPKRKFLQLTNENEDFKHIETGDKDDTEKKNDRRNVGQNESLPLQKECYKDQEMVGPPNNENHTISTKYSCDQCYYEASQSGNLKKHIQSVHEKIKYPCPHPQCERNFTQTCHLNRHVKKVHNLEN